MAGWEKGKRDTTGSTKDLNNTTLQKKTAAEERISHLEAALKECMQQLHYVREDQERRIQGAVVKASQEFDKKLIASNEKLAEARKKITRLESENSHLHKVLSSQEKVIDELSKYRTQVEADLDALVGRLDSSEKAKASLSYEVRVLEKELEIRNEETEFNRRTAEIAQKQHQDSLIKNAKLESECQRLRLLVRRRLPGPAALIKMKSEVEILGKNQIGTRRRRSNSSMNSSVDLHVDDATDARINFLTEQLLTMEEQNRSLQYAVNRKSSQSKFSKGETMKNMFFKREIALSDLGSDDKASCADSWASASISELEHFKNEKQSYIETPEINLMDDFAEMEKLAIVSMDYPATSSHHSSEEGNGVNAPSEKRLHPTVACDMVSSSKSETLDVWSENSMKNDLLKMLMEHCQELKISPREVLENMKVALEHNSSDSTYFNVKESKSHPDTTTVTLKVSRQASKKTFNLEASDAGNDNDISTTKKSDQKMESNVSIQIRKIIELLEGICISPQENGAATSLAMPSGYMVRVFQWKSVELSEVLQLFVRTCGELLKGKANLEQFVQLVASSLEWVMNHCFSLQDVSSMQDAMRSRLGWDESRSESEFDSGSASQSTGSNRGSIRREEVKQFIAEPANTDLSTIDFEERAQSQISKAEHSKKKPEKKPAVQSVKDSEDQTENWEANHEKINTCALISYPENDQGNKSNSFERPEETCNGQKKRSKSKRSNRSLDDGKPCEKQLRDDWEITAASEKLAECQETIVNLGKQLKALSSPRDAALFDTVIHTPADHVFTSTPTPKRTNSKRLSLLDNMLAEDSDQTGASLIITEQIQNGNSISTGSETESANNFTDPGGIKGEADTEPNVSRAIIPRKKKEGRSFLKKLFLWQKKGDRKKKLFS